MNYIQVKNFILTTKAFTDICHFNTNIVIKFVLLLIYYLILTDLIKHSLTTFKFKLEIAFIQALLSLN